MRDVQPYPRSHMRPMQGMLTLIGKYTGIVGVAYPKEAKRFNNGLRNAMHFTLRLLCYDCYVPTKIRCTQQVQHMERIDQIVLIRLLPFV